MNKALTIGGLLVLLLLIVVLSFPLFSEPSPNTLTQKEAVDAIIKLHPELAAYRTTSLPPSSIETKQGAEGWYVGFIQSGSGVSGILNAQCYHVVSPKNVIIIGTYTREPDRQTEKIALETCQPLVMEQPAPTSSSPTSTLNLGKCYIGGCSSQLCSDQPDLVSTCEYRAKYACYKTTTCKRQSDGQCGWTKTPELAACLANPQN